MNVPQCIASKRIRPDASKASKRARREQARSKQGASKRAKHRKTKCARARAIHCTCMPNTGLHTPANQIAGEANLQSVLSEGAYVPVDEPVERHAPKGGG